MYKAPCNEDANNTENKEERTQETFRPAGR